MFTQTDPIGIAGGLNTYGYAGGDPVNFSDPFGLCPWCIGAVAGMAVETGVQLWSVSRGGEFDGAAVFTAGVVGGVSGGLATAARIGTGVKIAATAGIAATDAAAASDAESVGDLAGDIIVGGSVGVAGNAAGRAVRTSGVSAPLPSAIRTRLQQGANSLTSRFEMRAMLRRFEEEALAAGAVAGAIVSRAGGGGG